MHRIIFLVFLLTLVVSTLHAAAQSVQSSSQTHYVKVGIFDNHPVVFTDASGTPQGIYVDLLNRIASREQWQVEYFYCRWADCLKKLKREEIDLLTSIGRTVEREEYMRFSSENVLNMWGQVFFREGVEIEDVFDLHNQKVAILKDGINGINFRKLADSFEIQCDWIEVDSYAEAVQLVESGKVTACILNNVVGSQFTKVHGIQASPVVFAPFKLLFAAPSNSQHRYLNVIDSYMKDWKAEKDSFYYKTLQRWYGGGGQVEFVIPQWLQYAFGIIIPCMIISLLWVVMLYLQIKRRKKVEQALTDSENRFRCLSDAAFEGVIITDQGRLLEVNDTFCTMFGYRPDEVVGKYVADFVTSSDQENVRNKILSGYEKPYETTAIARDGFEIPVEVHGRMLDYRGRSVRVAAIRDLSERKKAEEEKEKLIEHLQATLREIQTLRGILPICSFCKNIRNDEGYYEQIEAYIHKRAGVDFSHTICPKCLEKHYPDIHQKVKK